MSVWDGGSYEVIAADLLPAAARAVEIAGVGGGDRVLDVACGTGNAAAEAIATGALVTGVDTAGRLLEVARERVPNASFLAADATALPFDDGAFDAALSVFGVIFAPAREAAAELTRVVRDDGKVVVAAWVERGAVFEAAKIAREHRPQQGESTDWSDPDVLGELFAPREVVVHEETLVVHADSAQALADQLFDFQPMWVALLDIVGRETYDELRARTAAELERHNEDEGCWQASLPYVVAEVRV